LNEEAIVEIDSTADEMLLAVQREMAQRVRLALSRVKRELFSQLAAAGVVARVGGEHLYPTIPTAVAAFARRGESTQGKFRENG
jgi:SulP family sulfate permease